MQGVITDWSMSREIKGVKDYNGLCPTCFANPAWKARLGNNGWDHPAPSGPCCCAQTKDEADAIAAMPVERSRSRVTVFPTVPENVLIGGGSWRLVAQWVLIAIAWVLSAWYASLYWR
jgi:hypothetical protein